MRCEKSNTQQSTNELSSVMSRTNVMATDKQTEELLSENERKSVKKLESFTNLATESEPSYDFEVMGGSSLSLYSLVEFVNFF